MPRTLSALFRSSFGSSRTVSRICYVTMFLFILLLNIFLSSRCVNYVFASTPLDAGEQTRTFLKSVAGLNLSTYPDLSPSIASSRMMHSQHMRTDVRILLGSGSHALEASTTYVDNKLWNYKLTTLGEPLDGEKALSECLEVAKGAIGRYQDLFNASHTNGLVGMLSDAIRSQNSTIENGDALLNISRRQDFSTLLDYERYITIQWYKKINGEFISPLQSIWLSISKSGLVTGFMDNLATHYIASSRINVSEGQAMNISRPYAEAYAAEHGQEIVGAGVTLQWQYDRDSQRGDDFAIYPTWVFEATYSEIVQGINGYSVVLWADNGEVAAHSSIGWIGMPEGTGSTDTEYLWGFLCIALVVLALTGLTTFLRRKNSGGRGISR